MSWLRGYNATVAGLAPSTRRRLDALVAMDQRLYRAAVARLVADADEAQRRFGVTVLCPEVERRLLARLT